MAQHLVSKGIVSIYCVRFIEILDLLHNNGSSVALCGWRHRLSWYVRENNIREVMWCLVVGGVFGSMLDGKCDESGNGGKGGEEVV